MLATRLPRTSPQACARPKLFCKAKRRNIADSHSGDAGEDKSISQQASDTLGGSKPGEKPLMEQAQDFAKDTYDQVGTHCSHSYMRYAKQEMSQAAKVVTDTYNSVTGEGGSK